MDTNDAASFAGWWQRRNAPDDRKALADAITAGLVVKSGGLIWLTEQGKRLRAAASEAT
jgi:hypothetical protein